ncbi:hypothetical protein ABD471_001091 [Campylobacter jejuni]
MEVLFFQMEILFFRRHYNYVSLSLNGNFKDLLNFIQNLENLPIALKIDKIKLYNTQGLKLKLDLMFKFVNL